MITLTSDILERLHEAGEDPNTILATLRLTTEEIDHALTHDLWTDAERESLLMFLELSQAR